MTEYFDTNEENSLETYLEEKSLMSSADENGEEGNAITLMTMHSAKGLEYPLVFISGMEENLFPTARAVDESRVNPQAIEEERRLCYVGMTRAMEKLNLSYALRRYAYGNMIECEPSRFLNEIPTELIESSSEIDRGFARSRQQRGGPPARKVKPVPKPTPKGVHYEWDEPPQVTQNAAEFGEFVDSDDFLAVGQWVRHPKWGRGQIVEREGHGEKMKLSIRFQTQVKRVAVAYAQLEPA
jgi:DNA helicase-2/ATP-dependent DNA helicase PcrA